MQRLSGHDAGYLYMETSTALMHSAGLIIINPADAPDGFSFEKLRSAYEKRLDSSPAFRHRLVNVPLGLHHPVWVDDPDFDLDWHLRHVAVPSPGGPAELDELVAELLTIPLDRTRALWETWLIEGLEGGRFALLNKVHHVAMSDTAGESLLTAIFDDSPNPQPRNDTVQHWKPIPIPGQPEMLGNALVSLVRHPTDALDTVRRAVGSAVKTARGNGKGDESLSRTPVSAPLTSFNAPLTHRRAFTRASVSFETVKAVKNAMAVTVNDVILTVCAGALRHYLDAHGERPKGSLVAMVPVAQRADEGTGDHNDELTSVLIRLATDLDDPVERLYAIHAAMRSATSRQPLVDAESLQDWTRYAAPVVAGRAARLYSRMHQTENEVPTFNVPVSNIPGPPFPLYVAGARVECAFPIGSIFDGGGLNISVLSYLNNLDFSFVTCPDLVADPSLLKEGINSALSELAAGVNVKTRTATGTGKKTVGTASKRAGTKKTATKKASTKKAVTKKAAVKRST